MFRQTTADLGHLIAAAHLVCTHTHLRDRVQQPTDINACIEMTHTETYRMLIFIMYFYIACRLIRFFNVENCEKCLNQISKT